MARRNYGDILSPDCQPDFSDGIFAILLPAKLRTPAGILLRCKRPAANLRPAPIMELVFVVYLRGPCTLIYYPNIRSVPGILRWSLARSRTADREIAISTVEINADCLVSVMASRSYGNILPIDRQLNFLDGILAILPGNLRIPADISFRYRRFIDSLGP